MTNALHKILEPLRKMSGSEACFQLDRRRQGDSSLADTIAVALADGKLERYDEPLGKRFCTPHLYGWLARCAKHGRVTESRVFVQGLDHPKSNVRRACVLGLIHFPKAARAAARRRLDAPSAGTREAAVRVLEGIRDKKSQSDLQKMLKKEKSKTVRKALEKTLGGFGAISKTARILPKAKPSRFQRVPVSEDSSLLQNLRSYFGDRSGQLVSTEELAAAMGITPEQAESEMLSLRASEERDVERPKFWIRAHQVGWIRAAGHDLWTHVKAPLPSELDAYVAAQDFRGLDALLAAAGRKLPKGLESGGPPLKYRDGSKMSAGARAWFIAELFELGALLVRAAVSDESCGELAMWLVDKDLPNRNHIGLLANEAFTNDAGERYARRRLKRKQLVGWAGSERVAFDRWCLRIWRTTNLWNARLGGLVSYPRQGHVAAYQSVERLEEHFPHGDDASGSAEQWKRWIGECLEQAMVGEREWTRADFQRRYIDNPLARESAQGVVFELGERDSVEFQGKGTFALVGDRLVSADGATLGPGAGVLRVAHPVRGVREWPRSTAAFAQRERGSAERLEVPAQGIDGKVWARRLLRLWMLNGIAHRDDHFRLLRYDLKYYGATKVEFHHSGYYRDEAVKLHRINLDKLLPIWTREEGIHEERWMRLSPTLRYEIARDVHALHAAIDEAPRAPSSGAPSKSEKPKSAPTSSTGLPAPVIELAKSARSKCRGCRNKIEKGDWRLGDPYLVPGSSSGRTAMGWWHLGCALKGTKQSLAVALDDADDFPERDTWRQKLGV